MSDRRFCGEREKAVRIEESRAHLLEKRRLPGVVRMRALGPYARPARVVVMNGHRQYRRLCGTYLILRM